MNSALEILSNRFGLTAIYVFGSRAEEIAARLAGRIPAPILQDSDVDIGVLPVRERRLSAGERVSLMQDLEDIFHVDRVDLVILPEASPFLALDIIRGELIYTNDEDVEAEYQLYVLRRAGDLADWEYERRRMLLSGEAI